MARPTARKVRKAWEQGELSFLAIPTQSETAYQAKGQILVNVYDYKLRPWQEFDVTPSTRWIDRALEILIHLRTSLPIKFPLIHLELEGSKISPINPKQDWDAIYGTVRIIPEFIDHETNVAPLFPIHRSDAIETRSAQIFVEANNQIWSSEKFSVDFSPNHQS